MFLLNIRQITDFQNFNINLNKKAVEILPFLLFMALIEIVNNLIQDLKKEDLPVGKIRDGYHSFDELYEHRIALYISFCRILQHNNIMRYDKPICWRSETHSDGTKWEGWFILGIAKASGHQITYHLPISEWNETEFAETLDKAPEYDGHTSSDVLERLKIYF